MLADSYNALATICLVWVLLHGKVVSLRRDVLLQALQVFTIMQDEALTAETDVNLKAILNKTIF